MYVFFYSLPLHIGDISRTKTWSTVIPIIFTSFGFQGSLHTLTKFANNEKEIIRKACLFGSIIPAVVYCLWVTCVLAIIYNSTPDSFSKMLIQPIEVSELIHILDETTEIKIIQPVVWIVSFLAIMTSVVGVGLAFKEILEKDLVKKISGKIQRNIAATMLMIMPATLVAIFVPNAFIRVLSFAGIILVIISIIIPICLYDRRQIGSACCGAYSLNSFYWFRKSQKR
ncbi:MAG: hypothetical protein LBE97_02025 [Holosporales bacterium]|nr:hypothetical protein [Holosporales bacterium]